MARRDYSRSIRSPRILFPRLLFNIINVRIGTLSTQQDRDVWNVTYEKTSGQLEGSVEMDGGSRDDDADIEC